MPRGAGGRHRRAQAVEGGGKDEEANAAVVCTTAESSIQWHPRDDVIKAPAKKYLGLQQGAALERLPLLLHCLPCREHPPPGSFSLHLRRQTTPPCGKRRHSDTRTFLLLRTTGHARFKAVAALVLARTRLVARGARTASLRYSVCSVGLGGTEFFFFPYRSVSVWRRIAP